MDIVGFLGDLGIHVHGEHAATTVNTLGEFVVVVLIALLVTLILRKWLSLLIWKLMQKKPGSWHEVFYQQRFSVSCPIWWHRWPVISCCRNLRIGIMPIFSDDCWIFGW